MIAVQGATGSLKQAVDPRRWFALIERLRGDYALIVICATAFYLIGVGIAHSPLPLIVRTAPMMYAWLAVFALIGGVLHERRLEIEFDDGDYPEVLPPRQAELERQRAHLIDRIYGEWRSGAHKNAWQTIQIHIAQSADPLAELRMLHARISRWPDPRPGNRLAQELATRLLAAKQPGELLTLIDDRLRVNPDFRPQTGAELLQWIQVARDGGDKRIARALLKDFQRLYPEDALQARIEQIQRQMER